MHAFLDYTLKLVNETHFQNNPSFIYMHSIAAFSYAWIIVVMQCSITMVDLSAWDTKFEKYFKCCLKLAVVKNGPKWERIYKATNRVGSKPEN